MPAPEPFPGSDIRGTFGRVASTGVNKEAIMFAAARGRAIVDQSALGLNATGDPAGGAPTGGVSHARPVFSGRALQSTQSAPVLSFTGSAAPFQSTSGINNDVFGTSSFSRRELQPFAESPASSRANSGIFSNGDGFLTRVAPASASGEGLVGGAGDGFDPDHAFGSNMFNSGGGAGGAMFGVNHKRAFVADDDFDDVVPGGHDDDEEEMDKTDVEDEGDMEEEEAAPVAPLGRTFVPSRRGLSKTASLPASVFQSTQF